MQRQAVYELSTAPPHEPADARFSAHDFQVYQEGYVMGLLMASRVMEAAVNRFALIGRTRRLEAKRKREQGL